MDKMSSSSSSIDSENLFFLPTDNSNDSDWKFLLDDPNEWFLSSHQSRQSQKDDEIEEIISELGDVVIVSSDLQKKLAKQNEELGLLRKEIADLKSIIDNLKQSLPIQSKKTWWW